MSRKNFKISFLTLLCITIFAANLFAAYPKKTQEAKPEAAAAPAMDEATMAKMKEYSTPNENHQLLQKFVGN